MASIPGSIVEKLRTVLEGENLGKVYAFLAANYQNPMYIRILEETVMDDAAFQSIVTMIIEDFDKMEEESCRLIVAEIWNSLLTFSSQTYDPGLELDWSIALAEIGEYTTVSASNVVTALSEMPVEDQTSMLQVIYKISQSEESWAMTLRNTLSNVLDSPKGFSGKTVPVVLAGVLLTATVIHNMRRWWKGEISGKRCAKNIIDTGFTLAGGIGGGIGGTTVGTLILPGVGTAVGGIAVGILCAGVANRLSAWITAYIFDLPKEEAVENAFRFLGLHYSSSNMQINERFRRLGFQYRSENGGSGEDFHKLQYAMQVIRMHRGEN